MFGTDTPPNRNAYRVYFRFLETDDEYSFEEAHHPRYTPLSKVDDRMIREVGVRRFADDPTDVAWLDPTVDVSARSLNRD
jgi:hypothetical protein